MERTPSSSGLRRTPIIQLDMGAVAQQLAAAKRGTRGERSTGGGGGGVSGRMRPRPPEALLRCCSFCRFCWTCTVGACCSMAPPALAAAELLAVLLVYLLAVPNAWPTRVPSPHYSFASSADDVVLLSLLRCAAVVAAHAAGAGPRLQRPYLLTAAALAAVSLPLGLMKLAVLRHSGWPRRQWPPFVALYGLSMAFAAAHVIAAQRITEWARTRWEHGLGGLGFPWQQGEAAWLLSGQLQSRAEEGRGGDSEEGDDVPPEQLADPDSRWARCGGLRVHYKLALPQGQPVAADSAALVLVHSFGGGAFCWRHVQQPLADACGLAVLSFDRPGFGLTDRPRVEPGAGADANPYTLKSQALLTLQLASGLGFRRVVLAGHSDGALLALLAAAMACREAALGSPLRSLSPGSGGAGGDDLPALAAASPAATPTAAVAVRGPPHHQRRGSLPDSLDWAWMNSVPEGEGRMAVLQALLRGEWPASIEPRTSGGGSLLTGWGQRSPQRSPQRPRQQAASGGDTAELLQPLIEQEAAAGDEQQQQQQAGEAGTGASSSTEAGGGGSLGTQPSLHSNPSFVPGSRGGSEGGGAPGGGLAQQEASMLSVVDNPSFLSESSDREQFGGRYRSTQEAAVPLPALPEQQGSDSGTGGSSGSGLQAGAAGAAGEGEPSGLQLHDNPSFLAGSSLADSFDAEAASAARQLAEQQQQQQQQQQQVEAAAALQVASAPAAAGAELAGEASSGAPASPAAAGMWQAPEPVGLILLHPDLSGAVAPKYARVLAHSRLGRRVLRSLLRAELGEVTNRRAWADPHWLTPGLLALYRRPLHVQGWDRALVEVARARSHIHSLERAQLLAAVVDAGLPVLVATGEQDRLVPPSAVSRIAERLGAAAPRLAVLPACGHLSHEECPSQLLEFVREFLREL